MGNFLTSCKPVSFSRRTLHHGVSKGLMIDMSYGCWPRIMAAAWRVMQRLRSKCGRMCEVWQYLGPPSNYLLSVIFAFCKFVTIRAIQDPARVHDRENPLHQINFCYHACNNTMQNVPFDFPPRRAVPK